MNMEIRWRAVLRKNIAGRVNSANNRFRVTFGIIVLLMSLFSAAFAQTTGTIVGQVVDPSNASVVGANVEAKNLGTGLSRSGATNAEGAYLIPSLPPGTYTITVRAPGFKSFSQGAYQGRSRSKPAR